jgi:class 3 adenylate cyclase
MDRLSTRRAFVVEGAHLYGQLLDFDSVVSDPDGNETEASHRRLLQMLDTHYRLWDSIVENDDADRVDYHGARMHAIVSDPSEPIRQVERAVALAVKLGNATRRISSYYDFPTRIRFGIDQGKCVALTTGRAHEKDTLFLGSPANHAAKLAGSDDKEGIFLTASAQSAIGDQSEKSGTDGCNSPS